MTALKAGAANATQMAVMMAVLLLNLILSPSSCFAGRVLPRYY
jgi:hypothetical protein